MPILSSNFNQIGNAGQQPGTCFIETDDSLSAIQATGYLNTLHKQGLPLSENLMALVSINKGSATSTVWMAIHFSNENWSLVPSSIEPSLNAKYIVQQPNATLPNAQALSVLSTGLLKSTTTTGVISTAVPGTDYFAPGSAIPVTSGGTGVTTMTTAYAPVISGTTATGALQVASTGQSNSGWVLTSTGASSLPTWQAAAAGGVTSVTGTTNRVTSSGGTTPAIDISASYVGQSSITTIGTVTSGLIQPGAGGTGVSQSSTLTLGGNTSFVGAFTFAGTVTGNTTVTFPTSGTLATTATASGTVNSGTANQIAYYATSTNAVSGLATTARSAFSSNSTGVPSWVALTDGQILVGSTAGSPAAATLTAGDGITITPASNSITVAATGFQSVTFALTSANIKSMYATPIQLIAAPGAHKMIVVTDVCVEFAYIAPQYVGAGSWGIQYGNAVQFGGNIQIYTGNISLINAASDLAFVPAVANMGGSSDTVDYINLGVFISNDTSAYTLGNGILNVTLKYYIVTTTS